MERGAERSESIVLAIDLALGKLVMWYTKFRCPGSRRACCATMRVGAGRGRQSGPLDERFACRSLLRCIDSVGGVCRPGRRCIRWWAYQLRYDHDIATSIRTETSRQRC